MKAFTLLDGGLSTALEQLGFACDGALWTARWVKERPEAVVAAHRSFVEAGAEVIISASYQASVKGFQAMGCSVSVARGLLAETTALARRAGAATVAASLGPYGAILADGSEYHGRYQASWSEVRQFHRERIEVLADSGLDLFAVETIPSRAEAEIILEELGGRPAWLAFSCKDGRHLCSGEPIVEVVGQLTPGPLTAIGVNCTAPEHVAPLLRSLKQVTELPLLAYPNRGGHWDAALDAWVGAGATGEAAAWFEAGARYIGGCCGVGPDGIRELAALQVRLSSSG